MANGSILALAFLKIHWESGNHDYLDNFVPLIVEVVRESGNEVVALPSVQQGLKDRFGLNIPLHPLNNALNRARKRGYFNRVNGVLRPVAEAMNSTGFSTVADEINSVQTRVIAALREFVKNRFALEWEADEAEQALLDLLELDGTALLFASVEGRALNVAPESEGVRYAVSSFVCHAQSEVPELFESIETLSKGLVLAAAIFLPRPGAEGQRFRNTTVYFDTSFLIYVAGCAGHGREAPARELVDLLHRYGAKMRYFTDTLRETQGILDYHVHIMSSGGLRTAYGDIVEYVIAEQLDASDLELMAARLPEKLRYLRIEEEERPAFDEKQFVVDEVGFGDELQKAIHYRKEIARRHDVDCVSAIARFRRGRESFAIETCGALFVTTNVPLAHTTRRFFQPEATFGTVPLCLTDQALATVLWLKGPTSAPELPKKFLLRNALAATQPSNEFWKRYLAEIARLEEQGSISESDFALLRYSTIAKRAVMDLTHGEEGAFTEGTIREVLRRAEHNIRRELDAELAMYAEKEKGLEEKLGSLLKRIDGLQEMHQSENEQRHQREVRLAEVRSERIALAARKLAKAIMLMPRLGLFAVLILGIYFTFPWTLPEISVAPARYGVAVVLALVFVLQVVDSGLGLSLKDLMDRGEDRLADWLSERLAWLSPSMDDLSSEASIGSVPPHE